MQLFNVRRQDRGFTLIEMIVTVIVVAILSAVAVPSVLGMLNQTRIKDGLRQVESALKEGQKQAMRLGKSCTVTFNATTNQITSTPVECLAGSKIVDDRLDFKADVDNGNATNIVVTFSHKGHNTTGARTIAIYRFEDGAPVNNGIKKCVILTPTVGSVKSGIYTGDINGNIVQNLCDVTP